MSDKYEFSLKWVFLAPAHRQSYHTHYTNSEYIRPRKTVVTLSFQWYSKGNAIRLVFYRSFGLRKNLTIHSHSFTEARGQVWKLIDLVQYGINHEQDMTTMSFMMINYMEALWDDLVDYRKTIDV